TELKCLKQPCQRRHVWRGARGVIRSGHLGCATCNRGAQLSYRPVAGSAMNHARTDTRSVARIGTGGAVSHYKSNLRDIEFNLFEVLGRDEILGQGPFSEVDSDTAREVLAEVDRLAREDLAASYEDSDRNPPVFDPKTHTAPLPESFKKSYRSWMDAEFWRLQIREELGGTPAPSSLNWAIGEMVLGSNAPVHMYAAGAPFAGVLYKNANGVKRDERVAQIMVEREWG